MQLSVFLYLPALFGVVAGRVFTKNSTSAAQAPVHPCADKSAWYDQTYVERLCSANFPTEGTWFIEFYAPWCPQCQRFKPYWTYFGAPPAEAPGRVGAVDCTLEKPLCQQMGVNAYPTMK